MRQLNLSLTVLCLVGAGSAVAQDPEVEAVRAVVSALASYSQAGDFTGLDSLYASGRGVHIIEGAGVNHGWVDYRDHHLKPELAEFKNFSYRYFAIEPQVRGTAVLEKRDGRWLVVHTHTSGRRKPAAP